MDFDKLLESIAMNTRNAAIRKAESEGKMLFTKADGLRYCSECGQAVEGWKNINGVPHLVGMWCDCDRKRKAAEDKAIADMQRAVAIRHLKAQGFERVEMQGWTFENDDGSQPQISAAAKRYCDNFEAFKLEGKGLMFHGKTGTGKTYMAACIANELIEKGIPVLMTNFTRIVNRIQARFDGRQDYIDSLNEYDLLIIDDLAAERNTEYMNEAVFEVIDSRCRAGKPMIITTNISESEMRNPTDTAKGRIYSRVIGCCHPIKVSGQDRRKQRLEHDYKAMNKLLGLEG